MSLLSINIDDPEQRDVTRSVLKGLISNKSGRIRLSDLIDLKITRQADHLAIDWDGKVEVSLPGVDPDLVRARLYEHHAGINLHISSLRIEY